MLKRKGEQAASLRVAEQWVSAWKEMAKKSNTLIAPWVYYLGEGVVARRASRFQGITQGNYSNRNLQTKQLSLWSWFSTTRETCAENQLASRSYAS